MFWLAHVYIPVPMDGWMFPIWQLLPLSITESNLLTFPFLKIKKSIVEARLHSFCSKLKEDTNPWRRVAGEVCAIPSGEFGLIECGIKKYVRHVRIKRLTTLLSFGDTIGKGFCRDCSIQPFKDSFSDNEKWKIPSEIKVYWAPYPFQSLEPPLSWDTAILMRRRGES